MTPFHKMSLTSASRHVSIVLTCSIGLHYVTTPVCVGLISMTLKLRSGQSKKFHHFIDQTGVSDEEKSVTRQIQQAKAYMAKKRWTVLTNSSSWMMVSVVSPRGSVTQGSTIRGAA